MILPVDKPAGMTSHDVVDRVRKSYHIKKVGHAGTLDPFATGVLIILVGRESTKQSQELMHTDKEYQAQCYLGWVSDSHDPQGEIEKYSDHIPSQGDIDQILERYQGDIEQIPPMHSAIKIGGQKLYHLARQGKTIERPPRQVHIQEMVCDEFSYPTLDLSIRCGSGTYIRSLARDIGQDLGTGAYLTSLRRRKVGDYRLEDCYNLDRLPEYT